MTGRRPSGIAPPSPAAPGAGGNAGGWLRGGRGCPRCLRTDLGPRRYADAGNPFPGAFASVAEPVGYFLAWLLGALCLGALI